MRSARVRAWLVGGPVKQEARSLRRVGKDECEVADDKPSRVQTRVGSAAGEQ
jgi:hypothetical protein